MKAFGVVLIVLGIVGLAVTGISFTTQETVADLGPLQIEREERRTVPIPAVAAGAALVAGIVLVVASSRRL